LFQALTWKTKTGLVISACTGMTWPDPEANAKADGKPNEVNPAAFDDI
jgi:hypothetical protein